MQSQFNPQTIKRTSDQNNCVRSLSDHPLQTKKQPKHARNVDHQLPYTHQPNSSRIKPSLIDKNQPIPPSSTRKHHHRTGRNALNYKKPSLKDRKPIPKQKPKSIKTIITNHFTNIRNGIRNLSNRNDIEYTFAGIAPATGQLERTQRFEGCRKGDIFVGLEVRRSATGFLAAKEKRWRWGRRWSGRVREIRGGKRRLGANLITFVAKNRCVLPLTCWCSFLRLYPYLERGIAALPLWLLSTWRGMGGIYVILAEVVVVECSKDRWGGTVKYFEMKN